MGGIASALRGRYEDERLTTDEADREDGDGGCWGGAPGDARADELLVAKKLGGARNLGLREDALEAVVDLRREEADGGFDHGLAGVIEDLYGKAPADLSGALGGDVDVGFEISVLVDGGEDGGGRDIVAEVDRDVADDAGVGSADLVVGELLPLGSGEGYVGLVVSL